MKLQPVTSLPVPISVVKIHAIKLFSIEEEWTSVLDRGALEIDTIKHALPSPN